MFSQTSSIYQYFPLFTSFTVCSYPSFTTDEISVSVSLISGPPRGGGGLLINFCKGSAAQSTLYQFFRKCISDLISFLTTRSLYEYREKWRRRSLYQNRENRYRSGRHVPSTQILHSASRVRFS